MAANEHCAETRAGQSRSLSPFKGGGLGTANKKRLALAFVVAAISDALSFWLTIAPPIQWGIDLVTALILFLLLGRKWVILPGLIAEAVPGLNIFPFWLLVVGSIAIWGTIRRPQRVGPANKNGT